MQFFEIRDGRKMVPALLLLTLFVLQVPAQMTARPASASLTTEEKALTENISLDSLKGFTSALAADEMGGRGTMQPGGDKAAEWIAERYKEMGLKPLGDKGSYLQSIKFRETVLGGGTHFKLDGTDLVHGKDWAIGPWSARENTVKGDMVFVAYGIVADSINRNDLKGVNLKNKVVVMIEGPPANIPKEAWETQKASQVFFGMVMQAGAKGVVFIGHGREKDPPEVFIDYFSRRQISLSDEDGPLPFLPPMLYASSEAAAKFFEESGVAYKDALAMAERNDFKAFELKREAEIAIKPQSTKGTSSNVVGYLEGSDPKLKEEAIVFTAHYDAYGTLDGKVYNGAADNALGTAEMLAVAEAYAKMDPKPKRSMVFLAVTGEEYGLYGSKYWAKNPTWEIKKVAANLNLDGIGTEVYGPVKVIVGYGAEHSSLGPMLEEAAAAYGITVMPDPMPEEKVFLRSDHYSFVERGVPALMLMGGPEGSAESLVAKIKAWEKVHYHQPSDDVMDSWHWEGAKTVADIMGILGLRIAQQDGMPSWNKSSRFGELKRGNTKDLPEEN
ncbi:MAG TPA: M20/M25/M40 family metallo-hydrolase [Aridibacter sp.]|nr:M20/M25/M40 family metallo-hydrolase [Aridibacter sp.]